MSAPRVLSRAVKCNSCRWHAFTTFAGFAGVSIVAARPSPAHPSRVAAHFSTAARLQNKNEAENDTCSPTELNRKESEAFYEAAAQEDTGTTANDSSSLQATPSSQDPSVPWYLQVQDYDGNANQRASRQQLPDLPPDSPERLGPTVEYLFKEAGLDDMRVLDLRDMDPPPALGSNLIMVLGTARSEKHLHVSADRFCRWLRSNYSLQPFADGLLGRNELKLKLRRKAKRAKLMGSKGPTESDADDGIRTGWICVNAGWIEESSEMETTEIEGDGIVGFGNSSNGVHLIVQMMTEEKREELDLEKLWLDALARQERRESREQAASAENVQATHDDDAQVGLGSASFSKPTDVNAHSRHSSISPLQRQQTRAFHTQVHFNRKEARGMDEIDVETIVSAQDSDGLEKIHDFVPEKKQPVERISTRYDLGKFWAITRPQLIEPYESALRSLASLPTEKAVEALGKGPEYTEGTEFLESCFSKDQIFPTSDYWACRLWIACYAMVLGHPAYSPKQVRDLFVTMENNLPEAPDYLFRLAVDTFVPCVSSHEGEAPEQPAVDQESIPFLVRMLSRLRNDNSEVGECFVFERLYLAKIRSLPSQTTSFNAKEFVLQTEQLSRLYNALQASNGHKLSEAFHLNALEALANLSPNLESFFDHWETVPLYSYSRSPAMYDTFFRRVAVTGNPALATRAIDEWVEMMDLESPVVALEGRIADNVMKCLRIIEPDIDATALRGPDPGNFRISLWRRCQGYWDAESGEGDL